MITQASSLDDDKNGGDTPGFALGPEHIHSLYTVWRKNCFVSMLSLKPLPLLILEFAKSLKGIFLDRLGGQSIDQQQCDQIGRYFGLWATF